MNIGSRLSLMQSYVQKRRNIRAYGTAEGVRKEWDTRGRSAHEQNVRETAIREHGGAPEEEHGLKLMNEVPRVDNIELEMTSPLGNNKIRMDKEALKMVLRQALNQLEESGTGQEPKIDYVNTPRGTETWHYANLKFIPKAKTDEGEKRVFDT